MVNLIRTMLAALLLLAVSTVYAQDRFTTECENLRPKPDAEFFLAFAEQVHNAKALFCSKKPLENFHGLLHSPVIEGENRFARRRIRFPDRFIDLVGKRPIVEAKLHLALILI